MQYKKGGADKGARPLKALALSRALFTRSAANYRILVDSGGDDRLLAVVQSSSRLLQVEASFGPTPTPNRRLTKKGNTPVASLDIRRSEIIFSIEGLT
jgi:hypothetical protein